MTAQTQAIANAEAQQDALRPLRQFVNVLAGAMNDQTWAGQDGSAVNPVYQYQTVGTYGSAVEGTPIATTNAQGDMVISSNLLMLALGAAVVYYFVK